MRSRGEAGDDGWGLDVMWDVDVPSLAMKMRPSELIRASSISVLLTPSKRLFSHVMGLIALFDHCTPCPGVCTTKYAA